MMENQGLTGLSKLKRELADLKSKILEIEAFVERLEFESSPPSDSGSAGLDLTAVADFVSQVETASNQTEILDRLLVSSSRLCSRVLLFLETEKHGYAAWKALGIPPDSWQGISVESGDPLVVSASEQKILTFDLDSGVRPGWIAGLSGQGQGACIPLVFGERSPAVLYVEDGDLKLEELRLLVELARLNLQNAALERHLGGAESPQETESRWPVLESLSPPPPAIEPWAEPSAAPSPAEAPEAEPGPAPAVEDYTLGLESQPVVGLTAEGPQEPVESDAALDEAPIEGPELAEEPESTYELSAFAEVSAQELGMSDEEFSRLMGSASSDWGGTPVAEAPTAEPVEEESLAPAEAAEGPLEETPSGAAATTSPAVSEDEAQHSEARRFARLLVAEIKLYNEQEVAEGLRDGNLYARLKADIDRSREMYERRASPSVRALQDYFDSELVRVLAEENFERMGQDYPGPRISDRT